MLQNQAYKITHSLGRSRNPFLFFLLSWFVASVRQQHGTPQAKGHFPILSIFLIFLFAGFSLIHF
jgi:hypothetical protein